jgi:hypothetical protein
MVIDSGRENVAYHVQVPNQEAEKSKARQLPVTLLSGFLVRLTQRTVCIRENTNHQTG